MTKTPGRLSSRIALVALALVAALPGRFAIAQSCQGDVVPNGIVDGADLGAMLSYWGPRTADPFSVASDIDGNGTVDGADLGALLASWGYCPATISSVSPTQGCLLGGTVVTISGTWLGSVASVTVDGLPCSGVTVNSPTSVRATDPAGTAGAADVAITTLGGTSVSAAAFTYREMVVSAIAPSGGLPAGGTLMTLTGECLGNVTEISVGGSPASAVTVVNDSRVTAITPPGPIGAASVIVSGGKGNVMVPGGFTYASPVPSWATLVELLPDPAVVTNPALRSAIAATGLAWRVRDTATQIEMLLVPPGGFSMGCSASQLYPCNADESPVHQVVMSNPFYVGRYEVTQSQWMSRMGTNPSQFKNYTDSPSRPVERVTRSMALTFLAASGMRFLTEAEWEYCYRAGTATAYHGSPSFPSGTNSDAQLVTLAWISSNSAGQTHAVGGKAGNAFGLHDMAGNVWEWVDDWYGSSYYATSPTIDPPGPTSATPAGWRLLRGGSWDGHGIYCRASHRYGTPEWASSTFGFRVARNP